MSTALRSDLKQNVFYLHWLILSDIKGSGYINMSMKPEAISDNTDHQKEDMPYIKPEIATSSQTGMYFSVQNNCTKTIALLSLTHQGFVQFRIIS